MDDTLVPVVIGLVIGIAFVTAFALGVASLPPTILTSADDTFYSSPGQFIIEDDLGGITFFDEIPAQENHQSDGVPQR